MKKATRAKRILDFLANNPGTHETPEIAKAIGTSTQSASTVLSKLARDGKIRRIKRGVYSEKTEDSSTDPQKWFRAAIKKLHSLERSTEDNEKIINAMLNTYEVLFALFRVWLIEDMVAENIDFEQRLLFIENFKWLTMIGDRLLKRWSLVHVGYDTNTRQAQEDAKAKTEAREKAALENAPLEEQVSILGSFDLATKTLIDSFPTVKDLSEEQQKEITA